MSTIAIVDRIEGDLVVLEVGSHTVHWPAAHLPEGAVEGSSIVLSLSQAPGSDAVGRVHRRAKSQTTFDL